MIRTFFKFNFAKYHVFCKWIMVRHRAECNKKENLGKKIKNHFCKAFLDLECSNFAESVSRLIRKYCKITFFYSKNQPTLAHHLYRGLPHVPGLRVALLIDHRLQETAASTFRLRVIIRSQQLVARRADCRGRSSELQNVIRQLKKEAGSKTRFALK